MVISSFLGCIVFIKYLQNGYTIYEEDYAKLLSQLPEAIKTKHRGKLIKFIFFHQAKVSVQDSLVSMSDRYNFELFDHTPYSPDLTLFDYHLFPNFKNEKLDWEPVLQR